MLFFKFHQNRTINEEFNFLADEILSGDPEVGTGTRFQKFEESLIQNSDPIPHRIFKYTSLIRKCLKFGRTDSAFGAVLGPPRRGGGSDFRISEKAS